MTIQKIGHCCMLIKEQGKTILTDPGVWSDGQNKETGIDIILITHEHQDHLHVESVKAILKNNPQAIIITNSAVGKILEKDKIKYVFLEEGKSKVYDQVLIEARGNDHEPIYPSIPSVQNTGYFISNKFFYPGDSFTNPGKPVEVLALPVVGPWMQIADALDYALAVKPKYAFPVHDGFLKFGGPFYSVPKRILEPEGIQFIEPETNKFMEF